MSEDIRTDHHIKISALIEDLQKAMADWGDVDVVCAKDPEGNGYSPLAALNVGYYRPDSTWSGDWCEYDWVERYPSDYGDWPDNSVKAICLGPVN